MTIRPLAAVSLAILLAACPGTDDSGTDPTDPTDDTDPCASALTREAFIEVEAARFCDFVVGCPGKSEDDRSDCEASFESLFGGAACFDECVAIQCSAWLDDAGRCTNPNQGYPNECLAAIECD